MSRRVIEGIARGREITITVNGKPLKTYEGETVAAALLISGVRNFHLTKSNNPRAPYCNMGTCFTCRVKIASQPESGGDKSLQRIEHTKWVRACMTKVSEGLCITTDAQL